MLLQALEIENFRNLATQTLEFSDGVNLLCGKNAAGKTNTLECIYLFASGRASAHAKKPISSDAAKKMPPPIFVFCVQTPKMPSA